jgi:hypothetical protein
MEESNTGQDPGHNPINTQAASAKGATEPTPKQEGPSNAPANVPAPSTSEAKPIAPKSLGSIFSTYRADLQAIVLSPRQFFASLPTSGGFEAPVTFFAISAAVNSIIAAISHGVTDGVIHLVICLGLSFLAAAAVNRLAKALGGSADFQSVYRVVAYSGAVLLVAWIGWLSAIWLLYIGFLCYLGFSKVFALTEPKSIALAAVAAAILSIGF